MGFQSWWTTERADVIFEGGGRKPFSFFDVSRETVLEIDG